MRFKIDVNLKDDDFVRLVDVLDDNPTKSVELLGVEDFDFVKFCSFSISVESFGYSLSGMVSFDQPIGLKLFKFLELDKKTSKLLSVNFKNIKLSKVVLTANEIEGDLRKCLSLLERIFNKVCSMNFKPIVKTLVIDSESLERQLSFILRASELEKRGEKPKPFGILHAKSRKDAVLRSGDLVPLYLEKDKAYLYEDKNVYLLLPRDFVRKLLKLDNSMLSPSDQFTREELEVLRKFSMRKYVKKHRVAGKTFFHDLNVQTRKLLLKGLRNL